MKTDKIFNFKFAKFCGMNKTLSSLIESSENSQKIKIALHQSDYFSVLINPQS